MKQAFDKNGKEIHEFDVLKVFHYVGVRRKKHYMYKWVRKSKCGLYLYGLHLGDDSLDPMHGYILIGKQEGTEIVQSPWGTKQFLKELVI